MAQRDYAKRTTTRKQKGQVPGWIWMFAGLLVGLFIAFLVYLQQIGGTESLKQRFAAEPGTPARTDARSVKKQPEAKAPEKTGINFDFYKILPEMEVMIPKEELDKDTKPLEEEATYYLQVGSFQTDKDAESRKAELLLLNFTPSVQKVEINDQTWHRVRIGPFTDRRKADQARRRLHDNGIDFIMLKEKS
ncbi:MAG: SPOR domain-containing protein [Pseudomonadota bacterium]